MTSLRLGYDIIMTQGYALFTRMQVPDNIIDSNVIRTKMEVVTVGNIVERYSK